MDRHIRTTKLRIVLVLAAVWIAAVCLVHPLLGFSLAVLLVLVETAGAKKWIDLAALATAAPIGWALFVLALSMAASPPATLVLAISGHLLYGSYLLLRPEWKEGAKP